MSAAWGICCGITRRIFAGERMTEIAELVHIGMIEEIEIICPFHETEHQCSKGGKNDLEGDAKVLGQNLDSGNTDSSTVVRSESPDSDYKTPKKYLDPDETYSEEEREVQIVPANENCIYPVAYSAHHLIPAKESLKRASGLHKFIQKSKGKICCDLGYDVNGNENGVWLPGLHAVNSKGLNLWGAASSDLPDAEDIGRKTVKRNRERYSPLDGPRPGTGGSDAFDNTNMKWLYVKAAMNFSKVGTRQFHDRHPTYSGHIQKHLDSVAALLESLYGVRKDDDLPGCDKCKENRRNKNKSSPPIALLGWLNNLSAFARSKLVGKTRHEKYYTSSWCGSDAPNPRKRKRPN